jgi:hypothetical protein
MLAVKKARARTCRMMRVSLVSLLLTPAGYVASPLS